MLMGRGHPSGQLKAEPEDTGPLCIFQSQDSAVPSQLASTLQSLLQKLLVFTAAASRHGVERGVAGSHNVAESCFPCTCHRAQVVGRVVTQRNCPQET